jgi:hemolysin activation/secretion protein
MAPAKRLGWRSFAAVASALVIFPTPGDAGDAGDALIDHRVRDPAAAAAGVDLPGLSSLAKLRRLRIDPQNIVREIRFEGHPKLIGLDYSDVLDAFVGSALSAEDLASLRDATTRVLIEAGYINSGARIPRQSIGAGTLAIELIAGRLSRVEVEGTQHFRADYLEKRIRLLGNHPLNVHDLERRLQWLAAEPLIRQLTARLEPGLNPGDAVLKVEVEEALPYTLRLFAGNDTVRSIGSEHMRVFAGHRNLLGNRDAFEAYLGQSPGLNEWKVSYSTAINRFDTRLSASYRDSASEVVHSEIDLDAIRLESRSRTLSLGIEQPFRIGDRTELVFGVRGDLRRARTEVNDFGFFFTPGEDEKGRVRASVLRLTQQFTTRGSDSVLSARSTFSLGLDLFSASKGEIGRGSKIPDGTFLSWLGQVYWVGRLPERYRRSQIVARCDLQLARNPMLAMERMAVGGQRTVRGYPENAVIRDNGVAASLELRVPLIEGRARGWSLELTTFIDGGHAWNDAASSTAESLVSVGLGLRSRWNERLTFQLEWGQRLLSVDSSFGGIQGHGVHIQAQWWL